VPGDSMREVREGRMEGLRGTRRAGARRRAGVRSVQLSGRRDDEVDGRDAPRSLRPEALTSARCELRADRVERSRDASAYVGGDRSLARRPTRLERAPESIAPRRAGRAAFDVRLHRRAVRAGDWRRPAACERMRCERARRASSTATIDPRTRRGGMTPRAACPAARRRRPRRSGTCAARTSGSSGTPAPAGPRGLPGRRAARVGADPGPPPHRSPSGVGAGADDSSPRGRARRAAAVDRRDHFDADELRRRGRRAHAPRSRRALWRPRAAMNHGAGRRLR
jgi:hypothetical protein